MVHLEQSVSQIMNLQRLFAICQLCLVWKTETCDQGAASPNII